MPRISTRRASIAFVVVLLGRVSVVCALTNPISNGNVTVKLASVASINIATAGEPLDLSQPVGDSSDLFVATHGGQVRLIQNGSLLSTPFADIKSILSSSGITLQGGSGSDERGLLGLAFHPDFDVPGDPGFGKFYTWTSESLSGTATFTSPEFALVGAGSIGYQNVLREWTTTPGSNTLTSTSSRVLFSVNKSGSSSETNHNGGGLKFGPNNYLYLSLGDGGGGNDFLTKDSPTDGHTNVTGNGQDLTDIYGKIIRIDPLAPSATPTSTDPVSANGNYRIPASNPFVSSSTDVKEIFLYGLRNSFRFSFDKSNPNDLYIGDVGQSQREEVELAHVSTITGSNDNFGWPYLEGTLDNSNYAQTGAGTQVPIAEYTHGDGISISGGFIYRGNLIPQLEGKYVFGDLGGATGNIGRLFYMDATGGTISALQLSADSAPLNARLYSYGQDQAGNLYALLGNGNVVELIPEPAAICVLGMVMPFFVRRKR